MACIKANLSVQNATEFPLRKIKLANFRFDPYLMVSVTIPQNTFRKIIIFIVDNEILWKARTIEFVYDKGVQSTVQDMLFKISDQVGEPDIQNIKIDIASNYGKEDDIYHNQSIKEMKKNLRWYKLVVRKLFEAEKAIPKEMRVNKIMLFIFP